MTFRQARPTAGDDWLDASLQDLRRAVEFPRTPTIAAVVRARIGRVAQQAERPHRWRSVSLPLSLRFAGIALAVVLAIAGALAIAPNTRDALARFFGLTRVQIIFEDSTPAALPSPVPTSPTPVAGPVVTTTPIAPPAVTATLAVTPTPAFADQTATPIPPTPTPVPTPDRTMTGASTLVQAREQVPFPILVAAYPEDIGAPDEVYVQELGSPRDIQVILRYYIGAGTSFVPPDDSNHLFTLYQFKATGMFSKMVFSGTRLKEVEVDGARGFWLEGSSHLIEYRTSDGREVIDSRRQVTGNTLAWEVGDITYRLETTLPLDEARKIADSLR
ncbi:MAG: hypothetical protein HY678_03065 [Chloroflexi bacterium]|nr:hypothetical protein [Chloroflexota bacterium]